MNCNWLHRFAVLTALATLGLIGMGGLVTSHDAGMAVPDWPTSYGYNMFALPWEHWRVGGIFYEHSHRLWASFVGLLVVFLTRWLGGQKSRGPLALVGLIEVLAGVALIQFKPELKGAGFFLSGIGSVVLLAAAVWARNEAASPALARLGWAAFWLVQIQGLLGGLRVVLFKDQIGIVHAALAQAFFVLLCVISLMTSRWWRRLPSPLTPLPSDSPRCRAVAAGGRGGRRANGLPNLHALVLFTTVLIFLQLLLGATMRHRHAGLAIPDFPMAYGRLWPAMDAGAVTRYNQQRIETTAANPITAFQVGLQMAHRLMAVAILTCVVVVVVRSRRRPREAERKTTTSSPPPYFGGRGERPSPLTPLPSDGRGGQQEDAFESFNAGVAGNACASSQPSSDVSPSPIGWERAGVRVEEERLISGPPPNVGGYEVFRRLCFAWLALILVQAALGAWTIWSNKAADVATAHVVVGALSLVTGALLTVISPPRVFLSRANSRGNPVVSESLAAESRR